MKAKLKEKQNIPDGWTCEKLGDIASIYNGKTPLKSNPDYWSDGAISWFTIDDIRKNGRIVKETKQYITDKALSKTGIKLLPKKTILLCCTASVGEIAYSDIELTTNQQFNGLVVKDLEEVDSKFLFYVASTLSRDLRSLSGATTFGFVSVGKLGGVQILLPTLKEQQKIAEILGSVDEDIEKTKEVIETTETLKKGLMQDLFTLGIGHTKFKKTELGEIPESWKIVTFKDVVSFATGKLNSNASVLDGQYPFFTCSKETFRTDTCAFDQEAILLAGNNAAGRYSVKHFKGKFDAYQRTYVISVFNEQELNYIYLKEVLQSKLEELRNSSFGSTTKFLTLKLLESLSMKLPPIYEQKKIAEILSSVDEKISVNKKFLEKQTQLKKGLMQDLLSGVKRVSL